METNREIERTIDECLRRKVERRTRPFRDVSPGEIAGTLAAWLEEDRGERVRIERMTRAPGGLSKENFFFDAVTPSGRTSLLLRLDPGESIVETHRLREFQMLRAVEGRLPAPRAVAVDEGGARFGRPAILLEKVSGRTQAKAIGLSGMNVVFEPELAPRLAGEFVTTLAALHAIDPSQADLSAFDVPRPGTRDAAAWSLAWWERVWTEDRVEDHPAIVLGAEWLREHLPPCDEPVLVHGDFRGGNFLYDDGGMTAMLDWELGHLGDLHEDLAWILCTLFVVPGEDGVKRICGLFTRDDFLIRYERASGRRIDPERLAFYEAFTSYKIAVLSHATALRVAREGRTHIPIALVLTHATLQRAIGLLARATFLAKAAA